MEHTPASISHCWLLAIWNSVPFHVMPVSCLGDTNKSDHQEASSLLCFNSLCYVCLVVVLAAAFLLLLCMART